MIIAGREIGPGQPPYVVAEISGSHGGALNNALHLIDAALAAGADAVKTQCYEADTITLDCDRPDFVIKDGPWKGRRLHELYRSAQTPFAWHPKLYKYARDIGITIFSSVFDPTAVDLLESLGCPAYKIASFEIVDLPLIRRAAATGKPLIISTGMATPEEVEAANMEAGVARALANPEYVKASNERDEQKCQEFIKFIIGNITLLHCVSGYPTPPSEANLRRLINRDGFGVQQPDGWVRPIFFHGVSDHTAGIEVPIAATALAATSRDACIIEKHLMLPGVATEDAAFSLTPDAFAAMVRAVRSTWEALQPSTAASEAPSRQLRRSLYSVSQIAAGEPFSTANVRSIRPGYGLPPKHLPEIIGRAAKRDIVRGEALTWEMVG